MIVKSVYFPSVKLPHNTLQWETWMQWVTGSWSRDAGNRRNVRASLSPTDGLMGPIFWGVEGHIYSAVRCCLIRGRRRCFGVAVYVLAEQKPLWSRLSLSMLWIDQRWKKKWVQTQPGGLLFLKTVCFKALSGYVVVSLQLHLCRSRRQKEAQWKLSSCLALSTNPHVMDSYLILSLKGCTSNGSLKEV